MIVTFTNTSNNIVEIDISDVDINSLKSLIKLQFVSYLEYAEVRGSASYSSKQIDDMVVNWFETYDVDWQNKDHRIQFINQIMPEVKFGEVSISTFNPTSAPVTYNDN